MNTPDVKCPWMCEVSCEIFDMMDAFGTRERTMLENHAAQTLNPKPLNPKPGFRRILWVSRFVGLSKSWAVHV